VVWSFVYLALCRLVQLVVLLCRSERSKELEILVLRHESAIMRRQRGERGSGRSIERSSPRSRGRCRDVRRECLDRLLIFSRRQLEHVLRTYTDHYNRHRPHRSLALRPPERSSMSPTPLPAPPYPQLNCTDLLGGLIHEYERAA
jgi:Integrase core domain